jgi:cobalamin biosynthesis protein CobT
VDLPGDLGDARQGLRLVVSGDVEGEDRALTFDLATVRVGDTAALVTHGGLYGIDDTATRDAARAGAKRLRDVLEKERQGATKGEKTPKNTPSKTPKASPEESSEAGGSTPPPSEEETTEEDTSEQDTSEERSPDGTSADEDDYSDEAGRPALVTGPPPSPPSATA